MNFTKTMLYRVAKVFSNTQTFIIGAVTVVIAAILISKLCLHLAPESPRQPRVAVEPDFNRVNRRVGANPRRTQPVKQRSEGSNLRRTLPFVSLGKGWHPLRTQPVKPHGEVSNIRRTQLQELQSDGATPRRTQTVEPRSEGANAKSGRDFIPEMPTSSQRTLLRWRRVPQGGKSTFLELLKRRVKRYADHEVLFYEDNPDNRNPPYYRPSWIIGYSLACFYTYDVACFGYYRAESLFWYVGPISDTLAIIPQADFVQGCRFSRNYRWTVPEMLKVNGYLQDSATGSATYRRFLEHMRSHQQFNCTVKFDMYYCPGPTYCRHEWDYGRECKRNHYIGEIAYQLFMFDHPVHRRSTPPEAGQLTRLINDGCPYFRPPASEDESIRFPVWKNDAINAYVTVLYHYSLCVKPTNPSDLTKYCPNPCKNNLVCSKPNMVGNCAPIEMEDNKYQALIDSKNFAYLKPIFNKVEYCFCLAGYEYNLDTEECELQIKICQDKEYDCLNNGKCSPVPDHVREIIGREYDCECKPAWQGLRCEQARNPCRVPENLRTCGEFECRRSPKDEVNGYSCICTEGYILTRQTGKPTCADVNECATSKPCRNGGQCNNLVGSFSCTCKLGFSGRLCEIPPPEPEWLTWEAWSACSVTCSVGVQIRWRHCSTAGSCMGMRKDTKNCMGRRLECSGLQADRDPMLRSGGAGWREEEDAILDDAWYFREFQLLKMGINNRTSAEELLLIGLEDIAYFNLPIIFVVGIMEILVFISMCRQHRMRGLARAAADRRLRGLETIG